MLSIERISHKNKQQIYDMLQDIGEFENNFNNEVKNKDLHFFNIWLDKMISWDSSSNLPSGYVRQTTFILYLDERPIGIGKVRYSLTEKSKEWGGTIGYAIKTSERNKGYGLYLVKKLVEYAKEENIQDIVATIKDNNISSITISQKAGGQLIKHANGICYYYFA